METKLVDKSHEEIRRGAKIVSLNVVQQDGVCAANVNCVCANGYGQSDRQINPNRNVPWKRSEVSSANINVNQTAEINELIADIQRRILWFIISHNNAIKNLSATFQVKPVRGSDEGLRSSFCIIDSD